jgi:hypothetical protein
MIFGGFSVPQTFLLHARSSNDKNPGHVMTRVLLGFKVVGMAICFKGFGQYWYLSSCGITQVKRVRGCSEGPTIL